jgi:hypothetical protein
MGILCALLTFSAQFVTIKILRFRLCHKDEIFDQIFALSSRFCASFSDVCVTNKNGEFCLWRALKTFNWVCEHVGNIKFFDLCFSSSSPSNLLPSLENIRKFSCHFHLLFLVDCCNLDVYICCCCCLFDYYFEN